MRYSNHCGLLVKIGCAIRTATLCNPFAYFAHELGEWPGTYGILDAVFILWWRCLRPGFRSVGEIGLASKLRLDGAMDLISSISVGEQAIGFGLDDQRGLIGIAKAELGLNATLNDANRFFLRYEQKPIFRQSGHRLCLWHVQGKGGKLDNGGGIAAARCGFNYWCTK